MWYLSSNNCQKLSKTAFSPNFFMFFILKGLPQYSLNQVDAEAKHADLIYIEETPSDYFRL